MRILQSTFAAILLVTVASAPASAPNQDAERQAASDAAQERKAAEWIGSLDLDDPDKEARLRSVVAKHLKTIRDWHNEHPYTTVPAGINPRTGEALTKLDRQVIANSAMPESVHERLMSGLRRDLTEEQVEKVLDQYTVGKVAFTLRGYHAIVTDLTDEEEAHILKLLKEARERAVDFKNMDQISAIFEIYKTKCEQYVNSQGRDWRALYQAFYDKVQARKRAEQNGQ